MGYAEDIEKGLKGMDVQSAAAYTPDKTVGVPLTKKVGSWIKKEAAETSDVAKFVAKKGKEGAAEAWDTTKKVGGQIIKRMSPLSGGTTLPPEKK